MTATETLTDNAIQILKKRYLNGDETIDGLWDRVSGGNARFRSLMSSLRFMPNSPTLFNAGLNNGCTLSACFVFDVADEMGPLGTDSAASIHNTRGKAIAVAKAGGGVGYYFGNIRPRGSLVKGTHRRACGPVAVLRDYHGVRQMIFQGGKRDLAQMGVLPCWHDDVFEFVHCKDEDPKSLESFNISVGWTDESVADAFQKEEHGTGNSRYHRLWLEQCESAWKHGCPGMLFPDVINRANPNQHLGLINATNPCGETPNRSDEPCNLGSLNLAHYVTANREVNWLLLEEDVDTAIRFLDDILDRNVFPHPSIDRAARLTRKLGLGVMNWAEALARLHIHYDTEEAVDLAGRVSKLIAEVSLGASIDLARLKGPYAGYDEVRTKGPFCRNETRTSIAPTGTIAIIAGCKSWSIEPHYNREVERTTNEGLKLREVVGDDYDGFVPKVSHEIPLEWHVRHQAAFQKNVCLGVSKTINLPNSATVKDISRAYKLMYDLGCKGGTVYRDGCRDEQVLVAKKKSSVYSTGVSPSKDGKVVPLDVPITSVTPPQKKRKLPAKRSAYTVKTRVSGTELFLTVGMFPDGTVGEIFVNGSFGTTMAGMLNAFCITFSVSLQAGIPLNELVRHHVNTRFEPSGMTDNPDVPTCTSLPDLICRLLAKHHSPEAYQATKSDSGIFCPDCGAEAVYQAGCLLCPITGCGWSRCN